MNEGVNLMFITCETIMKLPYLEKLKLVAGAAGLNRIVEWVLMLEEPKYSEWLKGGEIVLTTGILLNNDEETLVRLVEDLNEKKLSGLIINIGPYIERTPPKVIDIANSLNFPIFELPFEVKFIDVTQSICRAIFNNRIEQGTMDNFMKDIIFGDVIFSEEIYNRAAFYGYNSQKRYYSLVIQINNFIVSTYNNKLSYDENITQTKQEIEQIVLDIFENSKLKVIKTVQSDSIIVMVPILGNEYKNSSKVFAQTIIKRVKEYSSNLEVKIGIGRAVDGLKNFKNSVFQAIKALKVLAISGKEANLCHYNDIGLYRLLFQIDSYEEMEDIYKSTLGKLIGYDNKNGTNLLETLEVYIESGGKLEKTAEILFIHRNTLKYRAQRIEEIMDCDLRNEEEIFNIQIAIKIGRFLKCVK
jgi:DNA-binding PucR family transcriptional regulator